MFKIKLNTVHSQQFYFTNFNTKFYFTNFNNISVIFVIFDSKNTNSIFKIFINHIILTFKLYDHKSREKQIININHFIAEMQKVKSIKKEIPLRQSRKKIAFAVKWQIMNNITSITWIFCAKQIFDKETGRHHAKVQSKKMA